MAASTGKLCPLSESYFFERISDRIEDSNKQMDNKTVTKSESNSKLEVKVQNIKEKFSKNTETLKNRTEQNT